MSRKLLDNELGGMVGFRRGEQPLGVFRRIAPTIAARGSLSSRPWNKCVNVEK